MQQYNECITYGAKHLQIYKNRHCIVIEKVPNGIPLIEVKQNVGHTDMLIEEKHFWNRTYNVTVIDNTVCVGHALVIKGSKGVVTNPANKQDIMIKKSKHVHVTLVNHYIATYLGEPKV